jgi:hypothetical protein
MFPRFGTMFVSGDSTDLFARNGGSVLRGSGWSVPCVSIQLTLSQKMVHTTTDLHK